MTCTGDLNGVILYFIIYDLPTAARMHISAHVENYADDLHNDVAHVGESEGEM